MNFVYVLNNYKKIEILLNNIFFITAKTTKQPPRTMATTIIANPTVATPTLNDEMVLFFKKMFRENIMMDIINRTNRRSTIDDPRFTELIKMDFDGTIESVAPYDEFWDIIMPLFIREGINRELATYQFTLINKTNMSVCPFIPSQHHSMFGVNFNILAYIKLFWNERLKDPIREWVQSEYCVCLK